jgi:predicted transcriptional regulator
LNRNDPDGVIAAVDSARKDLLKHHPHAEVLLSTALVSEKDSVQTVLKKMKECALSRILVMSDKAPIERGVIGAAEISDFLLNEADAGA